MKLFLLSIVSMSISFASCSQDIAPSKVPSVVKNVVQAKYPAATNIDWEKKNNLFEAEIGVDSSEVTVEIDQAGKIVRQKQDIVQNQLPAAILSAITSQYKDLAIDEVEKIEQGGTVYYQVELEAKGKKDVKVVFDGNGTLQKDVKYWD